MTGQDSNAAWDKWLVSSGANKMLYDRKVKVAMAGQPDHLEDWLRMAFTGGIEAAEAPWRDPLVSAERMEQI